MIFIPCNFPPFTLIPNYFLLFSIHLLGSPCLSPHSHLHNVCKLPTDSDISLYRSHLLHHSNSPNSSMKPPLSGQHPSLTLPLFSGCVHLVTPKLTEKVPHYGRLMPTSTEAYTLPDNPTIAVPALSS